MSQMTRVGCSLICICLMGASCVLAQESSNAKKAPSRIKSAGCVRAGVEAGCLVLKGLKDNTSYSLHFTDKKPEADTAISFEGEGGGVDTCQQGIVVNVTTWTPVKTHCPKTKR